MKHVKEISSVKNSIQTRLSGVMILVLVLILGINIFIFNQIHTAVKRIDAVFPSNTAINELSESLEQVENTVFGYLNTKSTQALENSYRYEQNYKNLIEELNDKHLDNEVKMLEKTVMYTVIQVKLLEMQVMYRRTNTVMHIKMYRLRNKIKIFLYLGIKLKVVLL